MNYDVDFFIRKFENIPSNKWCVGDLKDGNKYCAGGHCGLEGTSRTEISKNMEIVSLLRLFEEIPISLKKPLDYGCRFHQTIAAVNDGDTKEYRQRTPKKRILAALYDIKSNQAVSEVKEIIKEPSSKLEKQELQTV